MNRSHGSGRPAGASSRGRDRPRHRDRRDSVFQQPTASSKSATKSSASDIAAALQKPATITFWAWAPQAKDIVTAFEKQYPNVKVNLVNAGTGNDEYTKLQNAIKAGSGAPDVAQIEYYALPQFALTGSLADLATTASASLKSDFAQPRSGTPCTRAAARTALPQDSGPMALFYNKEVFDKYGLDRTDDLGRVRRRREEAARREPEGLHHQRLR